MDDATVPSAPDHVGYLDAAAATAAGRAYKQRLLDLLGVRPGQVVLDVGCGPGTDLSRLADAVGERGSVIGIDHGPVMVERARRRTAGYRNIEIRDGDAHALPLDSVCTDRACHTRPTTLMRGSWAANARLRSATVDGHV
jgi:ubiquinone/menaquinone biosynthesis C-methylase UbiE